MAVVPGGDIPIPLLRSDPGCVQCPYCGRTGPTIVEYKSGLLAYISCVGLTAMGCICGCCLVPFVLRPTRDVQHRCSSCRQILVTYERI